jgi:hypothetical protein
VPIDLAKTYSADLFVLVSQFLGGGVADVHELDELRVLRQVTRPEEGGTSGRPHFPAMGPRDSDLKSR